MHSISSFWKAILAAILVLLQIHYGKPAFICIGDLFFISSILFLFQTLPLIRKVTFSALLFFEGFELGAFISTGGPMDSEFVAVLKPSSMPQMGFSFVSLILLLGVLFLIFSFYDSKNGISFQENENTVYIMAYCAIALASPTIFYHHIQDYDLFSPLLQKRTGFSNSPLHFQRRVRNHAFSGNLWNSPNPADIYEESIKNLTPFQRIDQYFVTPQQIFTTKNYAKKNLIIISFESFEQDALGAFNPDCPESMPFLSSLLNHSIYTLNNNQCDFVHFTASAAFVTECGFPAMQVGAHQIHTSSFPKCIGNIFKDLGYVLDVYRTGNGAIHNIQKLFQQRGYVNHDRWAGEALDDMILGYIANQVFPKLVNPSKPRIIHIETQNTHLRGYFDLKCPKRLPPHCPSDLRTYDCNDWSFAKFFKKFEELNLTSNTEVIIYGDHQSPVNPGKIFGRHGRDRKLQVIIPYHEHRAIKRNSSHYDIGPTILDLMGVVKVPPFLYGQSLLGPDEGDGNIPSIHEMNHIYQIFSKSGGLMNYQKNCPSCLMLPNVELFDSTRNFMANMSVEYYTPC